MPCAILGFLDLQAEVQQGLPGIAEQHRCLGVHEQLPMGMTYSEYAARRTSPRRQRRQ